MLYPRQHANPQHSQVSLSGRDHKISTSLEETAESNRHKVHVWVCLCIQSTVSHPVEEMGWKQQVWDQAWIMTPHRGTASEKTSASPYLSNGCTVKMTRRSFTGLPYSKLLPDVLSQISVVEMFIQSELGQERFLSVLDKHEKPASWPQAWIAVLSPSIDPNVQSSNCGPEILISWSLISPKKVKLITFCMVSLLYQLTLCLSNYTLL